MGVTVAGDRAWKAVQMKGEKQGVSAWLRGLVDECGVSGTRSCLDIAEVFGIDCKHEKTCRDCIAKMMTAIADRIDAERALPEGVEWPRFEDGGLVGIGDELEFEGKTMLVCDATFYADGWALWCDREDMSGRLHGSYGERVKRPAPEVLGLCQNPAKNERGELAAADVERARRALRTHVFGTGISERTGNSLRTGEGEGDGRR